MSFAAAWMNQDIITLSEVSQKKIYTIKIYTKKIPYDITYMLNLKYETNELIYKTETDSHRKQIYGYQMGKGIGEG